MCAKVSVNKLAMRKVQELIDNASTLEVSVQKTSNGATVIDCGINVPGSFEVGKYVIEICLGGLGSASFSSIMIGDLVLPCVNVSVMHPAISTLASQFAGWRITDKDGKFFGMGSGPARALARKPKKMYEELKYSDEADEAVLIIETSKMPNDQIAESIAKACNINVKDLYLLVMPTRSLVGSIQVSGRIVETCVHRLHVLGFDPLKIKYGFGFSTIAFLHPDDIVMMGRTNDQLMAGGCAYLFVEGDDKELENLAKQAPACASKDYGRPFYEIFKDAGFDFYKIDPGLFAPAMIIINNVKTGKTFVSGKLNADILRRSSDITMIA
ncbi:MAG: methenyltetrahydromethanopterin cyclohydrolase [Candidatus Baldrarchaeia archaeon]